MKATTLNAHGKQFNLVMMDSKIAAFNNGDHYLLLTHTHPQFRKLPDVMVAKDKEGNSYQVSKFTFKAIQE